MSFSNTVELRTYCLEGLVQSNVLTLIWLPLI